MSDGSLEPHAECDARLQAASDEIAGHLETIRRQSAALGMARRRESNFREHAQYERCARLFQLWQRATGHLRSRFTGDRFKKALPFLSEYEDEMIGRAIEGLAFDPYVTRRKNGTEKRHDGWDLLVKSADSFEENCNKAPLNWQDNLLEHAAEVETRR